MHANRRARAVALAGAAWLAAAAVLAQGGDVTLVTVARGAQSGIDGAREAVVQSAAEWETLWKSHAPAQPVPPIDFQRDTVAAVFLGMRPTGGFMVDIRRARPDGDALVVEWAEHQPPADALVTQALTAPFQIVRFPTPKGPVRLRRIAAAR
jgi:hypothetical protein